jgi:hypothetical protein
VPHYQLTGNEPTTLTEKSPRKYWYTKITIFHRASKGGWQIFRSFLPNRSAPALWAAPFASIARREKIDGAIAIRGTGIANRNSINKTCNSLKR